MKTICLASLLLAVGNLGLHAQASMNSASTGAVDQSGVPAPSLYQLVNHGANQRVWERETYEKLRNGKITSHKHRYTELATGMYYKDASGNWSESREEIEAYPGGAIAQQGQYQVIFANNLNSAGSIDQQTPDGKRLRSNILGLAYYDSSSGRTVLIGQIQDSQGQLISSNQVIYTNAFSGLHADVRYTYKIGSFEQDVILREQPPAPESFGLDSATTEIQVLTEFLNPPQLKAPRSHRNADVDQDISWGVMRIGRGKAFDLGEPQTQRDLVYVKRQYATMDGRNVLVETLPLENIESSLSNLPKQARIKSHRPMTASKELLLPKTPLASNGEAPMKLALASPSNRGYVLDYVELDSDQDDYTFQADMTYYIANVINIDGTATFEGGTIIKFDTAPEYIYMQLFGEVFCNTSPYRPAIVTSRNDDTLGEAISNPDESLYYYWTGLAGPSSSDVVWHDLRFKYGHYALDGHDLQMSDCQFVNCLYPVLEDLAYGGTCSATNLLIVNAASAFSGVSFTTAAWQVTVSGSTNLTQDWDGYTTSKIALTNSLLVNVQHLGGATLSSNYTAWVTDSGGQVLQTVGAASCYLATNSPYRNAGTANVDPVVLADIATKTTYPPIVYADGTVFTINTALNPQAQRDNDSYPDLGYHYDPIDYVVADATVGNSVTFGLTAGTVLGWYHGDASGPGLELSDYATFNSVGTATAPCWIAHALLVQEGNGDWENAASSAAISLNGDNIVVQPLATSSFTKWAGMDTTAAILQDNFASGTASFSDCEFYSGALSSSQSSQFYTNCLFIRDSSDYTDQGDASTFTYQNCTFYDGGLAMARNTGDDGSFWTVTDTAFDGTAFTWSDNYGGTNFALFNYNAYNTNNLSWQGYPYTLPKGTLEVVGFNDVFVANYNWETSWFGDFYLPTNSPLINHGSTNANLLGLYHFTTQTNQVPETNSIVDIGYHYVATDTNGVPLDTNGDGIPDYIEDANGNGLVDSGEIGWNIVGDLGLQVIISQPKNGSSLP